MRLTRTKKVFGSVKKILGDSVVNRNKTGVSYYDSFLTDLDYMQKNKNRTGYIAEMTPAEYYQMCASDVFDNTSVDRLIKQRKSDHESLDSLQDILDNGGQFWLPYINLADKNQEGLHRMMVLGDNYGWNTKFPVLIVESVDPRVDKIKEAYRQLNRAQSNAKDYLYKTSRLPEDFVVQTQYELEKYDDETLYKVKLADEDESKFAITLEGFEDEIEFTEWYGNLRIDYEEDDEDDWDIDEELEDADLEDIEDFFFK